jgi:hypothetical protein
MSSCSPVIGGARLGLPICSCFLFRVHSRFLFLCALCVPSRLFQILSYLCVSAPLREIFFSTFCAFCAFSRLFILPFAPLRLCVRF